MLDLPPSGWRTNPYGRYVSPREGERLAGLQAAFPIEIEERERAYVLRSPRWCGQVVRISASTLLAPPVMAERLLRRALTMMPTGPDCAGVHVRDISCNRLVAFRIRVENRASLVK
jgi:hypothetical protein